MVSEKDFEAYVETYLKAEYGEDNVYRQLYFSSSERFCDLYVHGPLVDMAIEMENTFEECVKGTGQALMYAAERGVVPVVVVPSGELEQPEADILGRYVALVEVDVPDYVTE